MLTGKRLFEGKTTSDVLAAVIRDEPDLSRAPAKVRPLLKRCLEKDPQRRLRDIGDAMGIIENTPEARPVSSGLLWAFAAVAAAFALAFAGMSFVHFRENLPAQHVLRYTIPAPENTTDIYGFAVSPDGRLVAITADVNGKRQLWLRALDALEAQPIPGTDDAFYPFWSPDGRYIAFSAQGKLKKITARGGPAQSLCPAPNILGSWNREDVILFSRSAPFALQTAIHRVSANGGVPAYVIGEKGHNSFPASLPDGRHFLYLVPERSEEQTGVYLSSLDGKENRRLLSGANPSSPAMFAGGRLLFVRENTLMAQPFDATGGRVVGEAFPVVEARRIQSAETGSVSARFRRPLAVPRCPAWFSDQTPLRRQ
jgi:hypothetical protein